MVPRHEVVEQKVEEGIRQTRAMFHQLYIDKIRCADLVESLRRYRRHINQQTLTATSPVHDQYSHGADMLRYTCININSMVNSTEILIKPRLNMRHRVSGGQGWMAA